MFLIRWKFKFLLPLFLAMFISLPPFTYQILPSFASYNQTANVKNEKISYKKIRERKHGKSNLKNQVGSSCQFSAVVKTEVLPTARSHTTSVWNSVTNKAYIIGGFDANTGSLDSIVEYNPLTGTVTTKSEVLPTARYQPSAAWSTVTNKAYIFSGQGGGSDIVEYDPANGMVTLKAETLSSTRRASSAVFNPVNNKIYILGGQPDTNLITEYDPSTGTVTNKAETLPFSGRLFGAVWSTVNSKIYIFGGITGSTRLNTIVEYDPATGTVATKSATLPSARDSLSAIWSTANNRAYIFGGTSATNNLNDIIQYDPATDTIIARPETLPITAPIATAIWSPINNKGYIFGGRAGSTYFNQILEYTPCSAPSNPVISSATLNGIPQAITSSYRITAGQTFVANASSTDAYSGNKVTISCNPPAGRFTPSPAFIGTGRLELTAGAADVGNTYTYTFTATSDSGAQAASSSSFTVSVSCSPPDNGCTNGNICVRGACCAPCVQPGGQGKCASDPSCVFTAPSQPLISSPAAPTSTPNPTPITNVPTSSATATPTSRPTTATPVQNITNSGSNASSQGTTVSSPQINTTAPSTNTQKPPGFISVSEGTVKGVSSPPQPTPTNIPGLPPGVNYFDISKLKPKPSNNVKPDSSSPYIDVSKGEVKSRK